MNLTHKIRLNPTKSQEEYFIKAAGVNRFVYNWALSEWKKQYENGERPNHFKLKKEFNQIKQEQFPFVLDVHRDCSSQPFSDLQKAFNNFFRRVKNGEQKLGYPKFKSKKRTKLSFYIANDQFVLNGNWVRIPRLGWVNMSEQLRFDGKILSSRIIKDGNHWFISISVEVNLNENYQNNLEPVGIDLGIKTLMTLSDGVIAENQRITIRHEKRLRKLNKKLSRQIQGSKNWLKTVQKLQNLYNRIRNQRLDYIHKWTSFISSNYGFISIEDLSSSGMLKNHKLAKHISDASFAEIVRQIEYKQFIYGSVVQKINRWFPSSKTCSECGNIKKDLTLSDRDYICENCGIILNRDLNAAINILKEGLRLSNEKSSLVVASSA